MAYNRFMKTQRRQLTEMGRALQTIGSIRNCWLLKNPAGTWSFTGLIPGELCDLRKCSVFGDRVIDWVDNADGTRYPRNWQSRIYPTREAGVEDLARLGYAIYDDGKIVKPAA